MDLTKGDNLTTSAPLLGSTSLNIETNSASSTPTHQNRSNSRPFSKKVAEEIKYDDAPLERVNETAERKENTIEEEEDNLLSKSQGGCTMKKCYADAHEISFKPAVFCEFFLLHVLFYFCLGPFIIILTPIVGIHLLKNQSFIGWTWPVLRQYLEYITVIGFLILYYTWNTNGLQAIEIYMLVVAVMIRIVSISSKYAYQSDCFIKLLRTETLTDKQLARHLPFLPEWRVQSDELIETELHSANLRLEIDSSLFFFHFIEKPSQELMDVLSKREQLDRDLDIESITMGHQRTLSRSMTPESRRLTELLATSKIMSKKTTSEADMTFNAEPQLRKRRLSKKLETDSLDGFTLAFDIIKNARIVRSKHIGKYAFLVAVVRALIPTFYRAYQSVNLGEDVQVFTERPYVAVPLILINSVFFWMCFYVVIVILEDIQARIYSLKQVEHLLSARKVCQSSERKLCPTMNIFDPVTLKAWLNLRKLIEDYGKKYVLRNNFNVTITLTFYAIILLILNLQLLGIIHIYSNPPLLLVFAYESVVFFAVFIVSTMGGAVINEQFTVHKGLLRKNKLAILDFQKMSHLYVGENAIEPDKPLYREGLKLLKEQLGEEDFQNKLVERAEVLVNIIDSVIEELDFEATSMPFTVMGVAVDFTLVKSFLVAAASLIFAIVQRYIN